MQPKSFDERFHVLVPGRHRRLVRDAKLLGFLAGMVWRNLTLGAKVRRLYRARKIEGRPFWLEDSPALPKKGRR